MTHVDLFSGIGGFALAARWAGFRTVQFCEIDPYCQELLRKLFPNVPIHDDIRTFRGRHSSLLTGGFPCQPFSSAGKRLGREDDRYLWPDMRRVIEEGRPDWIVGENVIGLDGLGLDDAIDDLEAIGYQVAPPLEIPACSVGAKHLRYRIWIVGHANGHGEPARAVNGEESWMQGLAGCAMPDAERDGLQGWQADGPQGEGEPGDEQLPGFLFPSVGDAVSHARVWRADHGVQTRMDVQRNMAIGNAIVPQVAYQILKAISQCSRVP